MSINNIKCGICHSNINILEFTYQSRFTFSLICRNCQKNFSEDDLELMSNIFLFYGGYFGKLKTENISLERILKQIIKDLKKNQEIVDLKEISILLMHKMLLHGYRLEEFIKKLEILLKFL